MKPQPIDTKYIEWKSAEELHQISMNWISELKFIKDELTFLTDLIINVASPIISKKIFAKSNKLIKELDQKKKELNPILKKLIEHCNKLIILIDGVDQLKEEKKYKKEHQEISIKISNYFDNYKKKKRETFDLVKDIIKKKKQKKLLN